MNNNPASVLASIYASQGTTLEACSIRATQWWQNLRKSRLLAMQEEPNKGFK